MAARMSAVLAFPVVTYNTRNVTRGRSEGSCQRCSNVWFVLMNAPFLKTTSGLAGFRAQLPALASVLMHCRYSLRPQLLVDHVCPPRPQMQCEEHHFHQVQLAFMDRCLSGTIARLFAKATVRPTCI
eukprot:3876581-Rhodomonas_salina.3